jgi:hypothetical protein
MCQIIISDSVVWLNQQNKIYSGVDEMIELEQYKYEVRAIKEELNEMGASL